MAPHATDWFLAHHGPPDASQDSHNSGIRRVDIATGATTTLAGGTGGSSDGVGGSAQFTRPWGIAIDPSGTFALVAVRAWPVYPGVAPCIPQTAHPPRTRCRGRTGSRHHHTARPDLWFSSFYVCFPYCSSQDQWNHLVRRVDIATGATTTLAGSTPGFSDGVGASAQFYYLSDVAIHPSGTFALVMVRAWLER